MAPAAREADPGVDSSAATDRDDAPAPLRWNRTALSLAVVTVAAGAALRLFAPSPLWLDEALSVNVAALDFEQLVEALRHDGHPALYYLLLGWWIDAFGDSDLAVRSLSGLFSVLSVWALYRIAGRHGATTAQVTLLVAATSPFLIRYATEARMYALLVLLCCVGWLCVERAIELPSPGRLALVALSAAALVHTHYWSFYLIGAALIVAARNIVLGDDGTRAAAVRIGGAIVAGGATIVVWASVLTEQLLTTGTPWADRARPAEIVIEAIQAIGGSNRFEGELLGVTLAVAAILGVLAWRVDGRDLLLRFGAGRLDRAALCVVGTLGLGGSVAAVTAGAFEARYAAVVVGFLLVLAAKGIAMLPGTARIVVLVVVVAVGLAVSVDEARRDRTQGAEVAALIDAQRAPGDVVVVCPDQLGPATLRPMDGPVTSFAYPRGDGRFVDWQDYAETIADAGVDSFVRDVLSEARGHDVWLVSGFGYKNFGDRCEAMLNELGRERRAHRLLAPRDVFEPMLLTRYEAPQ
ncbi:MAG: glycosyltransferase family 39 protein [Acidimicrobiaceae bacterium]|nr:glycosyltransferase family 39 protein [Acidimicrobiia bacterium]MCY4495158.1 glycosyltransferase family 39 protein [Acidimicrobiaceae bacterium]